MKIYTECLPCLLKQSYEASCMATDSETDRHLIINEVLRLLCDHEHYRYAPELFREVQQIILKHTGEEDPYRAIKKANIQDALQILPVLRTFVDSRPDRLHWALKAAATGNIIDSAIYKQVDVMDCLGQELEKAFRICDLDRFRQDLKTAHTLMIIGDNAGETVFDRILIEELPQLQVYYAVRSAPAINDAIMADAVASGLDQCAQLISSGCPAPGLILDISSPEFLDLFAAADLVISKGQGNYETLEHAGRSIYFLLKAKCPAIAKHMQVEQNDYVFLHHGK